MERAWRISEPASRSDKLWYDDNLFGAAAGETGRKQREERMEAGEQG